MQAGFDLSEIDVNKWRMLCKRYGIDENASKTEMGWVWIAHDTTGYNFVVTANNPFTGEYYHNNFGVDTKTVGYCGYVGIEGTSKFVADFFTDFKELADYIKDEEFGRRGYI